MGKKVGLSIVALIVAVCLCLSVIGILGAGVVLWSGGGNSLPFLASPTLPPTATQAPRATTLPSLPPVWTLTPPAPTRAPAATSTPAAGKNSTPQSLPANITQQMDAIQQQVIGIRGLKPGRDVLRGMLTPDQLRKKVLEDFFVEYTQKDAERDVRILSQFGLLNPGFNLYQLYVDLYSEQVAGYYDSKTKEMFVVADKGFGGSERTTYAHEYNHALQDQNYDLREGLKIKQDYCKTNTEYCAAVQALIEGDSVLTEETWTSRYATAQDRKDIQEFQRTYKSPVYDSAPAFLKDDFLFPYMQGFEFVMTLYTRGNFSEVDKAYRNPPQSTSQILHPEKYPGSPPVKVSLPDLPAALGAGWTELDRNSLGEWYTYLVLAKGSSDRFRLSEKNASQAAAGWVGDQYAIYSRSDGKMALLLQTRWEKAGDVTEFASAFEKYGQLRWGKAAAKQGARLVWDGVPDGTVILAQKGLDTVWIIAPDKATADKLIGTLPGY